MKTIVSREVMVSLRSSFIRRTLSSLNARVSTECKEIVKSCIDVEWSELRLFDEAIAESVNGDDVLRFRWIGFDFLT